MTTISFNLQHLAANVVFHNWPEKDAAKKLPAELKELVITKIVKTTLDAMAYEHLKALQDHNVKYLNLAGSDVTQEAIDKIAAIFTGALHVDLSNCKNFSGGIVIPDRWCMQLRSLNLLGTIDMPAAAIAIMPKMYNHPERTSKLYLEFRVSSNGSAFSGPMRLAYESPKDAWVDKILDHQSCNMYEALNAAKDIWQNYRFERVPPTHKNTHALSHFEKIITSPHFQPNAVVDFVGAPCTMLIALCFLKALPFVEILLNNRPDVDCNIVVDIKKYPVLDFYSTEIYNGNRTALDILQIMKTERQLEIEDPERCALAIEISNFDLATIAEIEKMLVARGAKSAAELT